MIKQTFQNKYTHAKKIVQNSLNNKIKNNWSRDIGAGFICEDIEDINILEGTLSSGNRHTKTIEIIFNWDHRQQFKTLDLSLRESEELLKFINFKIWESQKPI